MKHKWIKTIFSSSMVIVLAACGGGGSGSSTIVNANNPSSSSPSLSWNDSLTLNDNNHLYINENKLLVRPPLLQWQVEIDKAVQLTNQLRAEKGLSALKVDASLSAHAQRRAEELAGHFSHTRPNGEHYTSNSNSDYIGENIAAGNATAEHTVMQQWKNSTGHYNAMIHAGYSKIGIGMVVVPGSKWGYYWVQIFGGENASSHYVFDDSNNAKQNRLTHVTQDVDRYLPAVKWIHVDGVAIPLHHVAGNGSWHTFTKEAYSGLVNGFHDTRFGVIRKDKEAYKVFYRGNNTTFDNIPQTGSARYVGKAIITDGNTLNTNIDAQFQADFDNKKLTGVLSENGKSVVDINAHISGAVFHSPQNSPVETQGSFFGEKASELGGVFHENTTGKYGAFGAKR